MSPFALLDPVVTVSHAAVVALADVVHPLTGAADVAVAVVLLTVAVRLALLPLAVRVVRADLARRALAPQVARLRRRHGDDPERLVREIGAVHRAAGISPFAGLLPALTQAPVLATVYRLCVVTTVAGHPNAVLAAQLFGAPLAAHAPTAVAAAGVMSGPGLVVLALLAGLVVVAWLSSAQAVRRLGDAAEVPAGQVTLVRVLPFGTLVVAAFAPLALAVHLLVSTAWTLAERAVLPRLPATAA